MNEQQPAREDDPRRQRLTGVMDAWQVPLLRYAAGILRDHGLAQDAVQETFVTLAAHWRPGQTPRSEAHLRNWLYKVVHNKAVFIMNKTVDYQELAEKLHALPAPCRLDETRRARILRALPDGSAGETTGESRKGRGNRSRKMSLLQIATAAALVMAVLGGLVFPSFTLRRRPAGMKKNASGSMPAEDGAVSEERWDFKNQAPDDFFAVGEDREMPGATGAPPPPSEPRPKKSSESSLRDATLHVRVDEDTAFADGGHEVRRREGQPQTELFEVRQSGEEEESERQRQQKPKPARPSAPKASAMNSVAIVQSPVIMRGIVGAKAEKGSQREDHEQMAEAARGSTMVSGVETPEKSDASPLGVFKKAARLHDADPGPFTLIPTQAHPFSTFGLDTDTAGYSRGSALIRTGIRPAPETIRQEEFVNAFDYGDTAPLDATFQINVEGARSPFRSRHHLLRVGVKARRLGREEERPLVLTLLLDTSGSMETPERMPLARQAIVALLEKLADGDSVTVLTCSDRTRMLFSAATWGDPRTIEMAERRLGELQCQGATHLEAGIVNAFEVAAQAWKPRAENQVVILSDGIANLGSADADEILKKVADARALGIRGSVIGVGRRTYNDTLLSELATQGDGRHTYLDSPRSINGGFVADLEHAFNVIASDVKIQVEWNADAVQAYRSHGYDSRALRDEQFRDDSVDAGEVGSGQGVSVVYELNLAEPLPGNAVLGTIRIRWRRLDTGAVEEMTRPVHVRDVDHDFSRMRPRFQLAAAVAEFATALKHLPPEAQKDALRTVAEIAARVAVEDENYSPAAAFAETVRQLMDLGV